MVRGRGRQTVLRGLGIAIIAVALSPAATIAAGPPQVDSSWATGVSASAATVHAEVDPDGLETHYRFEYIAAGADYSEHGFEHALRQPSGAPAGLGAGSTDVEAAQHLVPLAAATTYHYRVWATNSAGTTTGPDLIFTTQESGAGSTLLDSRGWEMVSPVDKNGGAIQGPGGNFGGDVLQAAAQGGAVTYSSGSAFGDAPPGAPPASQYISTRGASGWSTQNVTAPTLSGSYGANPDGVPYRLFSEDLARGLMLNGRRCGESEPCPRTYSLWEAGAFAGLPEGGVMRFEGASPDLRHLVFATEDGLSEWSGGGLNAFAGPGASLAAPGAGSISADGSRVYFSAEGNLYLSEPLSGGVSCGLPCELVADNAEFQAASLDGGIAFFTREISAGNVHLYRYEAATQTATDLAPFAGVEGVLGISADGSYVYYADDGEGFEPLTPKPGLFVWHAGATTRVVPGAEAAQPSDYPPALGTARVSADGSRLLFLSTVSLTGYDNTDQVTGEPDIEVYLYEAGGGGGGALRCLSCNPTNARPFGPSSIPGAVANGSTETYKPRVLSANARRVFFDSADSLVSADSNGRPDVYEWEAAGEGSCARPGGCLALLSGGRSGEASFIDASESGGDAFFLTEASLVGQDPGSVDLYDAREGGGFAEAPGPTECIADACQPLPEPPEDPTVGTTIPGPPNPSVPQPSCPKGKHRVTHHGKSRCVAKKHKGKHRRGSRK